MSLEPLALPIFKLSATGNDFLLVDLLTRDEARNELDGRSRSQWVKLWCDRFEGLGADGAVFIEKHESCDFKWDFYNSDGGHAEMCGNAARAVSLYVATRIGKTQLRFHSAVGPVEADVHAADNVEVRLPAIHEFEWGQALTDVASAFDLIRVGVPHAVIKVTQLENRDALRALAQRVKNLKRFTAAGVNVTFVKPVSSGKIESVTFERGVEDFTRSCGTGAVAAAYSLLRGKENEKIEVQVPGGQLFVVWKHGRPSLQGPARIVAEMHWMRS